MAVPPDAHCAVLIPSCSEPEIAQTISSIGRQTYQPVVTVVVLNNCNDNGQTRRLATEAAESYALNLVILEMAHNPHMKAGALNYGYDWIRQHWPSVECLIQMDADSELQEQFIQFSVRAFSKRRNRNKGALSCKVSGKPGLAKNRRQAAIMWLQCLEFEKYHDAAVIRDASVVAGAGCALRVEALEGVKAERGYIWATDSLVEDYELTLRLKRSGWVMRKHGKLEAYTDLMPSVKSLIKQRERWQRGTYDELRRYGLTKFTFLDIMKLWLYGASMMLNVFVWSLLAYFIWTGQFQLQPIVLGLVALILLRQAYHVRSMGWLTMILVATLIPDLLYGALRNYWWLKALILSYGRTKKAWT